MRVKFDLDEDAIFNSIRENLFRNRSNVDLIMFSQISTKIESFFGFLLESMNLNLENWKIYIIFDCRAKSEKVDLRA